MTAPTSPRPAEASRLVIAVIFILLATAFVSYIGFRALADRRLAAYLPDFADAAELKTLTPPAADAVLEAEQALAKKPMSSAYAEHLFTTYHANGLSRRALAGYERQVTATDDPRWLYLAALVHEEFGESARAREKLDAFVQREPDDALAWYKLGEACFNARDLDAAYHAFANALDNPETWEPRGPRPPVHALASYIRLGQARILFDQARYQQVVETLLPVLAATQDFGPAYRMVGRALEAQRDHERAAQAFAAADALPPFTPPVDPTIDRLSEASQSSAWLLKESNVARNKGDFAWAEHLLKRAVALDATDADAASELALLYVLMDDVESMKPLMPVIINGTPSHSATLVRIGNALAQRNEASRAVVLLEKARSMTGDRANIHLNLGTAYAIAGDLPKAEASFREALRLEPESYSAKANLARSLFDQRNFESFLPIALDALDDRPADDALRFNVGIAFESTGTLDAAAQEYAAILSREPDNVRVLNQQALLLMRLGRLDEATVTARRSVDLVNDDERLHMTLARILLAAGDDAGAKDSARRALELRPGWELAEQILNAP
jgi:tetratricopeptide (TPR) repeat protein